MLFQNRENDTEESHLKILVLYSLELVIVSNNNGNKHVGKTKDEEGHEAHVENRRGYLVNFVEPGVVNIILEHPDAPEERKQKRRIGFFVSTIKTKRSHSIATHDNQKHKHEKQDIIFCLTYNLHKRRHFLWERKEKKDPKESNSRIDSS